MIIPFLGILFENQPYVTEPVPFKLSAEGIEQNFGYYMTLIIEHYGKANALLFVSIMVIIITLFKNGIYPLKQKWTALLNFDKGIGLIK